MVLVDSQSARGVLVEGGVVRMEINREGKSAINVGVCLFTLAFGGIGSSTNSNFV